MADAALWLALAAGSTAFLAGVVLLALNWPTFRAWRAGRAEVDAQLGASLTARDELARIARDL